jgi:hypothetical protein
VWKAEIDKVADTVGLDRADLVMRHYGHVAMLIEQYHILTRLRTIHGSIFIDGAVNTMGKVVKELDLLITLGNPTKP